MTDFDEVLAAIEDRIRARAMIIDLCDLVLGDVVGFVQSPALIIKEFIDRHPQTDLADIKTTLRQLRLVYDNLGTEGIERFRAELDATKAN